jgi:hypothetical protein
VKLKNQKHIADDILFKAFPMVPLSCRSNLHRTVPLKETFTVSTMRPKARGLDQHGRPPGCLKGAVAGREEEEYNINTKQFVHTAYFTGSSVCPSIKEYILRKIKDSSSRPP